MWLVMVLNGQRKELELSRKQAAEKAGTLPKTISALGRNPQRCRLKSLFKLLSSLEIEMFLQPKEAENTACDW